MLNQKDNKMETITFTYLLTPEKKGYSVLCLDWQNAVFTQGENYNECRKNAIEITEYFFKKLLQKKLEPIQYPKLKKHFANALQFQLTFSIKTGKFVDISKLKPNQQIYTASKVVLA